jgi:hypothetical protein
MCFTALVVEVNCSTANSASNHLRPLLAQDLRPLEPWMREYMRLALSREGQELLQSLSKENGYIALEPAIRKRSVLMISGRHLLNLSLVVFCPLFGVPLQAQIPPGVPAGACCPSKRRGYLMADGSIRIVGLDDMEGIVTGLNTLYAKTHPGTRFTYVKGNSLAAIYSLNFDATAFARPPSCIRPTLPTAISCMERH